MIRKLLLILPQYLEYITHLEDALIWNITAAKSLNSCIINAINLSKPTGHVMRQQFNIQQLYALPTLYLCVLYLSENKQRLVPLTA